jgi:hypothetical protein
MRQKPKVEVCAKSAGSVRGISHMAWQQSNWQPEGTGQWVIERGITHQMVKLWEFDEKCDGKRRFVDERREKVEKVRRTGWTEAKQKKRGGEDGGEKPKSYREVSL